MNPVDTPADQVVDPGVTPVKQVIHRETIHHRLQPGGQEYNYASAAHGAKIVSSNPEAQGAHNILVSDPEKYMRNPCSSREQFVVVELSEETLVDAVVIGNNEYYSSNPRVFEVYGSMSYLSNLSEDWVLLGRCEVENVRHPQSCSLSSPGWAKFLKVKFLSHYEQQFYCTLTTLKVFGMDAMEKLREDMQSSSDHPAQGSGSNVDAVIKLLAEKVKALEAEQQRSSADIRLLSQKIKQEEELLDKLLAEQKLSRDMVKQHEELLEKLLSEQKLLRAMAKQDRQRLSFGAALLAIFICIFVGGSRTRSKTKQTLTITEDAKQILQVKPDLVGNKP